MTIIMAKKLDKNWEIKNRKAAYEYFLTDAFEAGIVLTGTEVKSIKAGNANLKEAYCFFKDGELFVRGMHVAEYRFGSYTNHDPVRVRKLLLKRSELKKLERRVTEKGMTVVPFRLYLSERGFIKMEIMLASGKKSFDKRDSIKERDNKRELDRMKKSMRM